MSLQCAQIGYGDAMETTTDPAREASGHPHRNEFVQALATGLGVLRAFTPERPALTLTDAAEATGISRASARRMLLTLVHLGYAVQVGRTFELTPKVLELGRGYWTGRSRSEVLRPVLTRASQRLQQSCSAGILDGAHLMYIARVHTERILRVNLDVGTRLPAFNTSMGRVLLAGLEDAAVRRVLEGSPRTPTTELTRTGVQELLAEVGRVREQGYAVVAGELDRNLASVAVPVRDGGGRVTVALNTALSTAPGQLGAEFSADELEGAVSRAVPVLQEAAREAEAALAR
ncbi:Transcriptional regulator, IclR family [Micrococcus lylae]|uniref:Transcriptional regulator, IclR family n=1 Tax=Micrococcus lylae TaxID=1273 RepID=A0A1R4JGM7_9MICC|nr:IclR family transcriptional regulator C-terminal domain-containing protein [Micrococcus lylae]SJN30923.1 Transcriptional regulator, IclR family [Micrococcus lylae]